MQTERETHRFTIYQSKSEKLNGQRIPDYLRLALVEHDTGEIYLSTITKTDLICAMHDGIRIAYRQGKPYLPVSWLRRQRPGHDWDQLRKNVLGAAL